MIEIISTVVRFSVCVYFSKIVMNGHFQSLKKKKINDLKFKRIAMINCIAMPIHFVIANFILNFVMVIPLLTVVYFFRGKNWEL